MKKLTLIFLLAVWVCTGCLNSMFYYPTEAEYGTPDRMGLTCEEVEFNSSDGTRLTGWFIPAAFSPKGTVIHFHGNAQNMTAHVSFVAWLPGQGFNLFVFDYRGYGRSAGRPCREGVYQDCIAAVDYVRSRPDVDPDRLVLLGQSLGGANAAAVAGTEEIPGVRAVAIDSAFFSYRQIARDKIGQIPVLSFLRWPLSFLMVTNSRSPGPAAAGISPTPLLIIHGTDDRVIPYHHGRMLFEAAREPKSFITVEHGRHTDAFVRKEDDYRRRLTDFFEGALEEGPAG